MLKSHKEKGDGSECIHYTDNLLKAEKISYLLLAHPNKTHEVPDQRSMQHFHWVYGNSHAAMS